MKYFLGIEGIRNKDIVQKFPKNKNAVSNWNNGWGMPTIFQLKRLSEITNVSMEELTTLLEKVKK